MSVLKNAFKFIRDVYLHFLVWIGRGVASSWNFGARLSTIMSTAFLSGGIAGVLGGAVGAVLILALLFVWSMYYELGFKNANVQIIVLSISIGVNAILIVWMFFKREYRYYWMNTAKLYRYTMQGKPVVKVIYLYKNKSCQEFIMPIDNGEINFKRAGKTYYTDKDALYSDLKGGWTTVIIEEDNAKARVFHTNQDYISADALARIILKVKDWAEIKANRKKKMEFFLLVGCLATSVCIIAYLYYTNDQLRALVNQACTDALNTYLQSLREGGYVSNPTIGVG